ncbi:MAG TPA: methyl-accepting chemotaxis protein [Clostridia bacterium]|nr:methyl-accepting chemotaxis protein [Clostridia bacterium]
MFKKFTVKAKGNQSKVHQDNETLTKMLPLIEGLKQGKKLYAEENVLGSGEISDAWNKMVDTVFADKSKSILAVNNMLGFITDMTYVKDMVNEVRAQNEALHTMSASSEEMSASIDDVASRSQSVAVLVSDSVGLVTTGNNNMKNAFTYIQQSFESVKTISKDVDDLAENMKRTEEIVDIIKGVAEQTNLLALNAAIEAARAGEQGKGFAVVAGEVKKLAEHTKESVGSIQSNIGSLRSKLSEVVMRTDKTASELESGKKLVNEVIIYNNQVVNAVQKVNDEIMQIAANTQEQTAATEELAQRVGESSQAADNLMVECNKTGSGIFKLSQINNELRLGMLSYGNALSECEMLEICKTDHLMWRWRVYNMIMGYEKIDIDTIGTHIGCRLGKWYYSVDKDLLGQNGIFKSIERPHIELHQLAKEAAIAYSQNDITGAEKSLNKMNECSSMVVQALDKLKEHVGKNK